MVGESINFIQWEMQYFEGQGAILGFLAQDFLQTC